MAKIELRMVDLPPQVVRTDAIQSFATGPESLFSSLRIDRHLPRPRCKAPNVCLEPSLPVFCDAANVGYGMSQLGGSIFIPKRSELSGILDLRE